MIGLEDRRSLARDIEAAHQAGARLRLACEVAGVDVRTLQRWKAHDGPARVKVVVASFMQPRAAYRRTPSAP
jgi:hypothetical protein